MKKMDPEAVISTVVFGEDSMSRCWMLMVWALLQETVNQKSRDKSPSPAMAGATVRAVFSGSAYPSIIFIKGSVTYKAFSFCCFN